MTTDSIMVQVQEARPDTYADDGWAASNEGIRALAEIQRRALVQPRHRRRSLLVFGGATVLVAAGGAAAVAVVVAKGRAPVNRHVVLCNQSASLTANGAIIKVAGSDPAQARAACAAQWNSLWPSTPRPGAFAVCVFPRGKGGSGGAQVVLPAEVGSTDALACAKVGAQPVS